MKRLLADTLRERLEDLKVKDQDQEIKKKQDAGQLFTEKFAEEMWEELLNMLEKISQDDLKTRRFEFSLQHTATILPTEYDGIHWAIKTPLEEKKKYFDFLAHKLKEEGFDVKEKLEKFNVGPEHEDLDKKYQDYQIILRF